MRPLALAAQAQGLQVAGSDKKISVIDREYYQSRQICLTKNFDHAKEMIERASIVVYSSAIPPDDLEYQWAKKQYQTIQLLHRMEFLNLCLNNFPIGGKSSLHLPDQIAVAGTHGKSSSTAMITWLLQTLAQEKSQGFLRPYSIFGAQMKDKNQQGFYNGQAFGRIGVYETDESDGSYLLSEANIRIILNIDQDHLSFYRSSADYYRAFYTFAQKAKILLLNLNDESVFEIFVKLMQNNTTTNLILANFIEDESKKNRDIKRKLVRIIGKNSDEKKVYLQIMQLKEKDGHQYLKESDSLVNDPSSVNVIQNLSILGAPMLQNAWMAMTIVQFLLQERYQLDYSIAQLVSILNTYPGIKRRMDYLGEIDGCSCFDDYAHHPTAIESVINAVRKNLVLFKKNKDKSSSIHVIFQPHRYSRTQQYYLQFARALMKANYVYILPIYAASEIHENPLVTAKIISKAMENLRNQGWGSAPQGVWLQETVADCLSHLRENDILLTLGAGDISWQIRSYLDRTLR